MHTKIELNTWFSLKIFSMMFFSAQLLIWNHKTLKSCKTSTDKELLKRWRAVGGFLQIFKSFYPSLDAIDLFSIALLFCDDVARGVQCFTHTVPDPILCRGILHNAVLICKVQNTTCTSLFKNDTVLCLTCRHVLQIFRFEVISIVRITRLFQNMIKANLRNKCFKRKPRFIDPPLCCQNFCIVNVLLPFIELLENTKRQTASVFSCDHGGYICIQMLQLDPCLWC